MLLQFIEYRLDQLENKHAKIAVNSAIWYFEGCPPKKMSAKSLKLFGPTTTKWQPCKVFAKLNGNHLLMTNILKLHKYQTFGLMKMGLIFEGLSVALVTITILDITRGLFVMNEFWKFVLKLIVIS